ncbi:monovalent cation/H(+) antiporter subunit G [Limibaculum sp. M0105]|uniref:Monovalent cation/H(+) antiporter subunit G n=1 Tax=Thermohalobaculum xanthum TaxID=2753746 RepID=A0A8J7M4H5_9RHOB|nr:monovalent cation/H(+) antiporter subunit G [Thermohalobaculum xanthum]MBK0398080.1 monovalent cation/H(+) antiporter subunit G [Thermohalobaculum xanthum]
MISVLVDILSWIALTAGAAFYVIGAVGMTRMPDLFTRMHSVSVSDTMGVGLLCFGMILQAGPSLLAVKIAFVVLVLWATGAVATHALARAALHDGAKPLLAAPDGRLVPTDCVDLFPELGVRLAQPLASETPEEGETPLPDDGATIAEPAPGYGPAGNTGANPDAAPDPTREDR